MNFNPPCSPEYYIKLLEDKQAHCKHLESLLKEEQDNHFQTQVLLMAERSPTFKANLLDPLKRKNFEFLGVKFKD